MILEKMSHDMDNRRLESINLGYIWLVIQMKSFIVKICKA
jgi:hypothetical protein